MSLTVWPDDISAGEVTLGDLAALAAFSYIGNETAASATPTAVKMVGIPGLTSTATAAGTTTLTNLSKHTQVFTGVTTQTITLPVVTTLPTVEFGYYIINQSTGALTVNSSGANLVQTIAGGASAIITCVLLTGTTAASWASVSLGIGGASGGTDNAIIRADGTGGKTIQTSLATVNDTGSIAIPNDQSLSTTSGELIRYNTSGGYFAVNGTPIAALVRFYGNDFYFYHSTGPTLIGRFDANGLALGASSDAGVAQVAAGVVKVSNGSTGFGFIQTAGNSRVTGTVTTVSVAPAAITGLSATLAAGRSYSGTLVVFCSAATAADGFRFDFDGGNATATTFIAMGTIADTVSVRPLARTAALATDLVDTVTTGSAIAIINFTIIVNGAGTFIPRVAKSTDAAGATNTVSIGSYMTMVDIT